VDETHGQCNARPTVVFPAAGYHRPLAGTKLYCLVNRGTCVWTLNNLTKVVTWQCYEPESIRSPVWPVTVRLPSHTQCDSGVCICWRCHDAGAEAADAMQLWHVRSPAAIASWQHRPTVRYCNHSVLFRTQFMHLSTFRSLVIFDLSTTFTEQR